MHSGVIILLLNYFTHEHITLYTQLVSEFETFILWCGVTSGNVPWETGRWVDAPEWHLNGGLWLTCKKPLVAAGWATSLLCCTNGLEKQSSPCRASIFGSEA